MKNRSIGIINFILLAGTGFMALLWLYTWHDMHTADGVGLYLFYLTGQRDRKFFDLLTDAAGALMIFGMLLVPCICMRRVNAKSLFRIFAVATAFLPTVNPGNLVHFPDNLAAFETRAKIMEGNLVDAFFAGFEGFFGLFRVFMPILIMAALVNFNDKSGEEKNKKYRAFGVWCVILIALSAIGFWCENIASEMNFAVYYIILVFAFSFWEKIFEKNEKLDRWCLVFFGLCAIRGIYRNIVLLSMTHM